VEHAGKRRSLPIICHYASWQQLITIASVLTRCTLQGVVFMSEMFTQFTTCIVFAIIDQSQQRIWQSPGWKGRWKVVKTWCQYQRKTKQHLLVSIIDPRIRHTSTPSTSMSSSLSFGSLLTSSSAEDNTSSVSDPLVASCVVPTSSPSASGVSFEVSYECGVKYNKILFVLTVLVRSPYNRVVSIFQVCARKITVDPPTA